MAIIRVNHRQLGLTAQAVDDYVRVHKNKVEEMTGTVNGMQAVWNGADYVHFKAEWAELSGGGSLSSNMIKSLENYAAFLREAERLYKQAQIDALNESRRLW